MDPTQQSLGLSTYAEIRAEGHDSRLTTTAV